MPKVKLLEDKIEISSFGGVQIRGFGMGAPKKLNPKPKNIKKPKKSEVESKSASNSSKPKWVITNQAQNSKRVKKMLKKPKINPKNKNTALEEAEKLKNMNSQENGTGQQK